MLIWTKIYEEPFQLFAESIQQRIKKRISRQKGIKPSGVVNEVGEQKKSVEEWMNETLSFPATTAESDQSLWSSVQQAQVFSALFYFCKIQLHSNKSF